MQLSIFNVYVPEWPDAGATLVYNTFTGGMAVVTTPELDAVRNAEPAVVSRLLDGPALLDLNLADPDVGIIVESREDEERRYRAWYEEHRARRDALTAMVSTTLACNFDCTYCCQHDVLDGHTMSLATAEATGEWLGGRARAIGAKHIHLEFVGGEPLLHPDRVETVAMAVRRTAPELPLSFGLITNGLFLTRELVERLVPLGLDSAQVTIDGDEDTHSITRRAKGNRGNTFQTIFDNVIAVAGRIAVRVRGNYQADTVHGFAPLVERLRAAGFPWGSRMQFKPALDGLGAPDGSGTGCSTWAGARPDWMLALSDVVRRAGYDPGDVGIVGPCGFHMREHFVVDPAGRLFKCPGFLGHEEWAIGDVWTGLGVRYRQLMEHDVQASCGSCTHRPECAGGCVAASWLARGRMEGVNCEIGFYEAERGELVKRRWATATSESLEEAGAMVVSAPLPGRPPGEAPLSGERQRGRRPAALRVLAA